MKHLIDKSVLVSEIERMKDEYLKHCKNKFHAEWSCGTLDSVLSYIDTLEVKEVDLEKESLTWKDIGTIDQLLWDLSGEYSGKSDNEGYYKAVLSSFKAQKGE